MRRPLSPRRRAQVVAAAPGRAASYNNRAQLRQLRGDRAAALQDLEAALALPRVPRAVRAQALAQRGMLREVAGDEAGARADYEAAAAHGSAFARAQLVRLNPYARLCNQMMAQVLGKCPPAAAPPPPEPPASRD
jgi:hypothetical protein